jgi:hypothetical protein
MSGRLLGFCHSLGTVLPTAVVIGLVLRAAPAQAQSAADAPEPSSAPAEPPAAPPASDAPAPSEPAPPSEAPPPSEPAPPPTQPPEGPAQNAEPPAANAAFAPLPAATREIAKPQPMPSSPPAEAATSATAKPVSHAAPAEPPKDDDNPGGLLGPIRLGVLVGSGLPEVLNFGAQLKLTRFFGAGVNVGVIPTVKIKYYGEAAQKYQEYDAYGHIYPFGGSFFLGAGVGYAQIDGTLVNHVDLALVGLPGAVDVTSDATVRTLVLTPQIGFMKIFPVGFAIGFDIGAQIPIAPSEVKFNSVAVGLPPGSEPVVQKFQTEYITPNDEKVRRTLETLGRTPLPTFNFKIGWFL